MADETASDLSMYEDNAPIGVQAALERTSAQIPSPGPTAADIPVRAPQNWTDFTMRGGVANTLFKGAETFRKELESQKEFDFKKKQFEELVHKQMDGAKQFYDEALQKTNGEAKDWIPVPDLFVDQKSGVFMPVKYYEAAWKGMQEYSKDKTAQKQAEALKSYREGQLDLGGRKQDLAENKFDWEQDFKQKQLALQTDRKNIAAMLAQNTVYKTDMDRRDALSGLKLKADDDLDQAQKTVDDAQQKADEARDKGKPPDGKTTFEYVPDPGYTASMEAKLKSAKEMLRMATDNSAAVDELDKKTLQRMKNRKTDVPVSPPGAPVPAPGPAKRPPLSAFGKPGSK